MRALVKNNPIDKGHGLCGAEWQLMWVMFLNGPKHTDTIERMDMCQKLLDKDLVVKVGDWHILTERGLLYALNHGMGNKKNLYIKNRGEDTYRTSSTPSA